MEHISNLIEIQKSIVYPWANKCKEEHRKKSQQLKNPSEKKTERISGFKYKPSLELKKKQWTH